jgi:hypothetical protein
MGSAAARRVALVEDEINHRPNRGEALGPLNGARRPERRPPPLFASPW